MEDLDIVFGETVRIFQSFIDDNKSDHGIQFRFVVGGSCCTAFLHNKAPASVI